MMAKKEEAVPLVPKLRFPEFQDAGEWEETTIGSRCTSFSGGTPTTSKNQYYSGEISFIRSAEIGENKTKLTITKDGLNNSSAKLVKEGDLLVALYGANSGDVALCRFVGAINQAILCLRSSERVSFLHQFLLERKNWILQTYLQGGQGNLSGQIIMSIPLALPKKDEQKKIAECLGSLDDLIAAENRKLLALRDHKKGLMQQLFPQPGETIPRLRFPEFEDAGEWVQGHCRDLADVVTGYGFPNELQGLKEGDYPFYKVSDISCAVENSFKFIDQANNYVSGQTVREIRGKPVQTGTIIFAKIGEAIRSNRRVVTSRPAMIDNNTAGLKPKPAKTSNDFLFHIWSTVSLIDYAGGVVPAVNKSAMEAVPLTYPSDPEQKKIAECLGSLDDLIAAESRKLLALRDHKKGLLQQLFPSMEGIKR